MDEIAEFSELGDYLSMPLRTYSTGMRVRLALGVVTSIEPEILLLDEGIGAVDAAFMAKARVRLQELVKRSGILVFASHSNDFWRSYAIPPCGSTMARSARWVRFPRSSVNTKALRWASMCATCASVLKMRTPAATS